MTRKKRINFNMFLNETEKQKLEQVAEALGTSQGQAARQAILAMYAHVCERRPCCADGHTCLVPHMHYQQAAPPGQVMPS